MQYFDGVPFLANPCNFALMLNVDWIQPYKHSVYSVGIIYLVILNLPREERYKLQNIIVVGVIPGPKEPQEHINSFVDPMVEKLLSLWSGIYVNDPFIPTSSLFVRAALVCLSADIPAGRKTGGFLGHTARMGCTKCNKEFPCDGFEEPTGFKWEEWVPRLNSEHRTHAMKTCKNKS